MDMCQLGHLTKCTTCTALHICLKVMLSNLTVPLRVTSYLPSVHWMLRTSYWSRKRWSVWCRVKPSTLSFKLPPLVKAWSVCLAPMFPDGFIIFSPSPINRENRRGHRSPPIHYPERKRRRCAGPAASSGVRPAHRAARQQARPVQETDGKAGVSTRRAETSPSLSGQEVQRIWMEMSKKSGGEVSVWKRLGVSQIRVGARGCITHNAWDGRSLIKPEMKQDFPQNYSWTVSMVKRNRSVFNRHWNSWIRDFRCFI